MMVKEHTLYNKSQISRPKGATRRPRGSHAQKKNKAFMSSKMLLWFVVGILSGIIITALTVNNWIGQMNQSESQNQSQNIPQKNQSEKKKQSSKKVLANKTQQKSFDFYTILQKHNSSNQQINPARSIASNRTLDLKTNSPNYVVQVSSFKSLNDAEELKAQLTLQGFSPQINSIRLSSGESWYRVTVGPFNSHETAKLQQARLAQEQYASTLVLKQK